ncbi:MAG TPA: amino acid adenylation domain-containing protein, partial [Thermoanaerobaculia bacterium]|nr:amino acid adenylation domain-containing protein [Thermoanaerobaculia bacterium]
HSLLATQLVSRVRGAFGVELPLRALFEQPTVAGLAEAVEDLRRVGEAVATPLLPVPRGAALPLSFAQERLWFLDQLQPESPLYNMPLSSPLPAGLDPAALERALTEVVRRHESLRTTFPSYEGRPVQVIAPAGSWKLPQVDLAALPLAARTAEARRLGREEALAPFDLAVGPLLRTVLLHPGAGEHVLLLTLHHIVSDGWSMEVLQRELTALYEAFSRREAPVLPELPIQYADFAVWQRAWLEGGEMESQLGYWREHLAGSPALLELPTDRPRPAVQTYRGARRSVLLPPELGSRLGELGRREGATLFMVLLAAFGAVLSRHAGQDDVVVGSPVANRSRPEVEGLIGFFVNTLALRMDLSRSPDFRELLHRVRRTALEAYARQDVPFERLVDELHAERSLSHSPLFQVMLVLQTAAAARGVQQAEEELAKFDLTLALVESGPEGLWLDMVYNIDLFDGATVERLLGHCARLLSAMARSPEGKVHDVPILGDAERHELRVEWNDTARAWEEDLCVHLLCERQARQAPDSLAVACGDEHWTYAELNTEANRLAHRLRRLGVGPESRVGVLLEHSAEMVLALLSVLKAGGAYVPLDPSYPAERLAFMVDDAGIGILLTSARLCGAVPAARLHVLCLDEERRSPAREPGEDPAPWTDLDNLAYVIYTSGSTGRPKGVAVVHRGLLNLVRWHQDLHQVTARDRATLVASPAFDASVLELWPHLAAGASLHVPGKETRSFAGKLVEWLAEHSITLSFMPTALAESALAAAWPAGHPLRSLLTGGDRLHRWSGPGRSFGLFNHYGPTECTVVATCAHVAESAAGREAPSLGWLVTNLRLYITDERMDLVPRGVSGEICLAGTGVCRGYLGRPDLTAERFVPDAFAPEPGARLYRTGDRGRLLADGELEFLERLDHQVKLRGFRIELGEIEIALDEAPGVLEAAAVLRDDLPGGQGLAAYFVPVPEASPSVAELRRHLRERLPEYMVPAVLVPLESLPRTLNGKIDRQALKKQGPVWRDERWESPSSWMGPRTVTEELVAGVWSSVLGVERIGAMDNFFEIGGHSLLATQVVSRLEQTFGVAVALQQIFLTPTVAGLAETLEAGLSTGRPAVPPILPVPRDGALPLSFAQERMWFLDQLEPGSPLYNIPISLPLPGDVDVQILALSLEEVVRRHESLRTTFQIRDGRPVQVVGPVRGWLLPQVDLTALPPAACAGEARRLEREESLRPFDLSTGPLLRTVLLRLGSGEQMLLAPLHHIIADGWSMSIFQREVTALYAAFSRGEVSPLRELPIQYADFAAWQRRWLDGEELQRQLGYWREHLAEAPASLELPTDRPRPAVQTYRGAQRTVLLPPSLGKRLQAVARQEGATLFMVLLGAFATLLSRVTGQEDVLVGSPIANRNRVEIEGLIGFFVNTLV